MIQLAVRLARSDWQGLDPILPKVVLRFAWTTSGVLCVMTPGELLMQMWPADSWDSPDTVSITFASFCSSWVWQMACTAVGGWGRGAKIVGKNTTQNRTWTSAWWRDWVGCWSFDWNSRLLSFNWINGFLGCFSAWTVDFSLSWVTKNVLMSISWSTYGT